MRLLLTIAIITILSALYSAEIKDGQLWLEVHILSGKQIDIRTEGKIQIQEIGSTLSGEFFGNIKLEIIAQDEQKMWGLIHHTVIVNPDSMQNFKYENIREKFIWQDGKLAIQYERLYFEDKYFSTLDAVEKYASETGYSTKQISSIPMQNASLKVTYNSNKTRFYQLPVQIVFGSDVSFNQQTYSYCGVFLVKPVRGELSLTNSLDIENYVAGVIPNEIGNLAPEEALKVQAVAARTHAISLLLQNKHINDAYDLCNATHCQVFKGNHLQSEEVQKSVLDTKNVVMFYDGRIADAVYHSSCGGKTETNQGAWFGKPIPFLQGVACFPELDSLDLSVEENSVKWIETKTDTSEMTSWEKRSQSWEKTISRANLEKASNVRGLHSMKVLSRGFSGRIIKLKLIGLNEVSIEGEYKIRQAFGGVNSSFFYIQNGKRSNITIYALPENIIIKGKGFGHGVGLCQVGALQKARAGWLWQDILSYYYPGTVLATEWLTANYANH